MARDTAWLNDAMNGGIAGPQPDYDQNESGFGACVQSIKPITVNVVITVQHGEAAVGATALLLKLGPSKCPRFVPSDVMEHSYARRMIAIERGRNI